MGVTIESKNHSINLGYAGFNILRTKIAELTEPDIFEHYKQLNFIGGENRKLYFEKYNKKIQELDEKYNYKYSEILDFLYSSDCGVHISIKCCKDLYSLIKKYDDNINYGYASWDNCVKFKDFKRVVKDCIDNNYEMVWY